MDCDSVNDMIALSTNTPFRVQRSTNLLAVQHVRTKISSPNLEIRQTDISLPEVTLARNISNDFQQNSRWQPDGGLSVFF